MKKIEEIYFYRKLHGINDKGIVNNNYDKLNIQIYHKINPIHNQIED